ncbi:methylesterase 17 [Aristolochia californica]|uniref:methylesterase 17 n=1 Tax=Aristolochia californica TaxID=171875 RepID=UPI0035DBDE47
MGEEGKTSSVEQGQQEQELKQKKKQHFVLVHGISHGAWCWYRIRSLLETSGHRVTCIDLAGAGIHPAQADAIVSFEDYNKPLVDFMAALPDEEQVILVGHSAGGLSITHVSHKFSKKIHLAIYIAASMLKSGIKSDQDIKDGIPDLSQFGDVYELGFGLGPSAPPTSAMIRKEFQRKILYCQSSDEDTILASMLLRPGPLLALSTAAFDGGDEIERVPRVYIKTTEDHVVKPAQQEDMIKRWTPNQVFTVDSDHSPFFSASGQLFNCLLKAEAFACVSPHSDH